jgi:hypothetical protein
VSEADPLVAELAKHAGWKALQKRANELVEEKTLGLANKLLRGYDTITPEALSYRRGYIAGLTAIFRNPTLDATKLERQLENEGKEDV